ncbi:MAG TPA: hypothetical protein VKR52_13680 [Terracidiphilus sp.]|nr:hypothetical protein [Terracidiphilus sp.]
MQTSVKSPPPTPIALKKVQLGEPSWNPEWDRIIEEGLPSDLLSSHLAKDVRPFCPAFKRMDVDDKREFWAYFFQALAGAEAGLEPTADVRHTQPQVAVVDRVTHRMVRAEGLLQLTYMDANRYDCNFDWDSDRHLPEKDPAKTILQPENNLACGITILENQLVTRHEHLISRKSYWETLRPGTAGFPNFIRQMRNVPGACRVPKRHTQFDEAETGSRPKVAVSSAFVSSGRSTGAQ